MLMEFYDGYCEVSVDDICEWIRDRLKHDDNESDIEFDIKQVKAIGSDASCIDPYANGIVNRDKGPIALPVVIITEVDGLDNMWGLLGKAVLTPSEELAIRQFDSYTTIEEIYDKYDDDDRDIMMFSPQRLIESYIEDFMYKHFNGHAICELADVDDIDYIPIKHTPYREYKYGARFKIRYYDVKC